LFWQGKYTSEAYHALRDTQERVNNDVFNVTSKSEAMDPFFIYTSNYIYW